MTTSTCPTERLQFASRPSAVVVTHSGQTPSALQVAARRLQRGELICVYARLPLVLRKA